MTVRGVAGGLLLGMLAASVEAQAPPPGGLREGPRGEAGRLVDAYVLSNLQESLGLSDDQFVKLLPLVKRFQGERREAMERRGRAIREMRRLLQSGGATETEVVAQLKELKAIETEEPERGRKGMESIDALLTPLQQAKFRVFEAEVGQKLRDLAGQLRRQNRPGAGFDGGKPRRPEQP